MGVQIAGYVVPLITIPYLARVLGVAGWGLVAFAQAFGSYVALLGEYGFVLSGTREVARQSDNKERLTEILAGVLGAKGLLAAGSLVVAVLIQPWVPIFRDHPILLWAGMFWALSRAFSMVWFFQGLERMRLVASLEISGQALATAAIFVLVRRPEDGWRVLAIQGIGYFLSFGCGLVLAYLDLPFGLPSWGSAVEALKMGWTMFLFRGSVSLYTVGNAFILGLFVGPQYVGYYAGAEKISKAFLGLLNPVGQTLYPRLSRLVHSSKQQAAQLARVGLAVMGVGGITMGVAVFVFSPLLVQIILGRGFEAAIPVMRILCLLCPLIALSNVFGIQWMLPLGLDRQFNTIIVLAGLINFAAAVILAPRFAQIGMAWAVVIAETFVTSAIYILLRYRRLDPFSYCTVAGDQLYNEQRSEAGL
jgi:PST family polysaccharide transporter